MHVTLDTSLANCRCNTITDYPTSEAVGSSQYTAQQELITEGFPMSYHCKWYIAKNQMLWATFLSQKV